MSHSNLSRTDVDEMLVGMSEHLSTEALVQRSQAGDRWAFGELAARYRQRLEALVETRMGKEVRATMDVADVVQETLARALQSVETFRFQGDDSFLRWLGGIAEHLIVKAASRGRRRKPLELKDDRFATGTSPSRGLRRDERFERLLKAIDGLPPDYREVLRLARIEGLKHEEIAAQMGRSHAAVRQLVVRALRLLGERFGDTESLHLGDRRLDSDGENDV